MNYIAAVTTLFQSSKHNLSERRKNLDFNFDFDFESLPEYERIVELIKSFPQRDTVTLTLTNENDDLFCISSQDLSSKQKFNLFKSDGEYSEQISGKLNVEKNIQEGCLSVYDFLNFSKDICSLSFEEVLLAFSALLSETDQLIFEVFDKEVLFKTKTMLFASAPQKVFFDVFDRKHRLNVCLETTHFYDQARYPLLPDDFQIDVDFEGNPLSEIFSKIVNVFSLVYLSSSTTLSNEILGVRITGQRTIEYTYQCRTINTNPELYKVYNWIFTEGNATDKALIARNILCLHCNFSDIQNIDGKTFASIQSNYNLYLKDNVSQYIQLTNGLAEFITEIVSKTGEYAISLLGNLKTNFFAIFSFFLTVILANIVSNKPLDNIFTRDITLLLEVILLGSVVYLFVCVKETKYKVQKVKDSYDALKENYSSILTPDDLTQAFKGDQLILNMTKEVNKSITYWALLWGTLILMSLIVIEIVSTDPIITPLLQQLYSMISDGINRIDQTIYQHNPSIPV